MAWGESSAEVLRRLRGVADDLEGRDADLAVVTHGGAIRALLNVLGLTEEATIELLPARFLILEPTAGWHLVEPGQGTVLREIVT